MSRDTKLEHKSALNQFLMSLASRQSLNEATKFELIHQVMDEGFSASLLRKVRDLHLWLPESIAQTLPPQKQIEYTMNPRGIFTVLPSTALFCHHIDPALHKVSSQLHCDIVRKDHQYTFLCHVKTCSEAKRLVWDELKNSSFGLCYNSFIIKEIVRYTDHSVDVVCYGKRFSIGSVDEEKMS